MIHPADFHPGEALQDYVFDELPHGEREAIEQHVAACSECALELDRLRMTTAALRTLPDREIPQRIAFVSDKVFEPSWFHRFWNSGAQLDLRRRACWPGRWWCRPGISRQGKLRKYGRWCRRLPRVRSWRRPISTRRWRKQWRR